MRQPRVRLRTVMTAIAFLALLLAVTVQSLRQQALIREERLRTDAALQRQRALMDQMLTGIAKQQTQPSSTTARP